MKKYELLKDDYIKLYSTILYRIRALKDFADVKKGDLGGYIESEMNLSQFDESWVYGDAEVWGNAEVYGDAKVYGYAEVYGDAKVYNYAEIWGNAKVWGNAEVSGDAKVYGYAEVYGDAEVWGNAEVSGDAKVWGNARVSGDARVKSDDEYIVFKNNWSSGRFFTYTKSNKMWRVGCFYGTGRALIEKAYADSELSGKCYEAYVKLVEQLEETQEGKR